LFRLIIKHCSIVFVHGWHGDQAPWTSAENSAFWPEKFLSAKVPEACILSFEYDMAIEAFWNEEDLISDFSNDLIDLLMEERTKAEEVGLSLFTNAEINFPLY
jgi:protein SERAC1